MIASASERGYDMEEKDTFVSRNSVTERLAQTDLDQLAVLSRGSSVDSPPFYNCFINRSAIHQPHGAQIINAKLNTTDPA